MKETLPLIFVSNDDGVDAKGLKCLVSMLKPLGHVVVVAPEGPRSGAACSISTHGNVSLHRVSSDGNLDVWTCSGTPVDCVKLGLEQALPQQPDIVIGGINHGDNASVNVHYSGTMGLVMEGCMKGVPSVGFSLCSFDANADFSPLSSYVQTITRYVLNHGLPRMTCLNVNFPVASSFQGMRICRMAYGLWDSEWKRQERPDGDSVFSLTGCYTCTEPDDDTTDNWALTHGYVAVTPTHIDVTDYELLHILKGEFGC
jgi:5'-nucleotidase